jgi:hypothetical protein
MLFERGLLGCKTVNVTSFAMFIEQEPNMSRNEECPASALGIIIFEVAEFKH